MKAIFGILLLLCSYSLWAGTYLGLSGGYQAFSSPSVDKYKVAMKGPTFGGFVGVGKDFVGLEGFYQDLSSSGSIKHDGETYTFDNKIQAYGAALRFSFSSIYLRLGYAHYRMDQSLGISDESIRAPAEAVYDIQKETNKSGVLYSLGYHGGLGRSARYFIDYTRYQITGVGHVNAVSVGISFKLTLDRFFSAGGY